MTVAKVKTYKRKVQGKSHTVKGYKRKQRRQGKKLKFKKLGTFYAAYDQYGNLKGSKIVKTKKVKAKLISKPKK